MQLNAQENSPDLPEEEEEFWQPLSNTKSYWIQTPTGTDKIWLDRKLYESVLGFFPNNRFPIEVGEMLMRYARKNGLPRSASGRILWKTGSGMTKSQVATALLKDLLEQSKVSAN